MDKHPIYKEPTYLTDKDGNKYWVIGKCLYPEDEDKESSSFYIGWYFKGYLVHRLDGPAMEFANGSKWWFQNGLYHRLDGPAVEWSNGSVEYWIEGKILSEEQWLSHPLVKQRMLLDKINRIKEINHE